MSGVRGTFRRARRKAGVLRRRLFEAPEAAAWRRAWHQAEMTPRFTPGTIRMIDYEIQYSDLLSFCPQWKDIFVHRVLEFRSATPSPRILDCGANVGLASLFFKREYPQARVTAFEADPGLCAMLRHNLRANGATDVDVVHGAVWTSDSTVSFRSEGSDSGMIESLPGAVEGRAVTVPAIRLRDVLAREPDGVDLLKLDIEGAEDVVLADCGGALDRVHAIVMDLHEFDARSRQAPAVLERLTRSGFTYAVDQFVSLWWRKPLADKATPFPGQSLQWAMTVRAWRDTADSEAAGR